MVLFHGGGKGRFGRVSRRGHEGVLVVERNEVQHQVADGGVCGAEDTLHASGAFLKLEPDHRGAFDLLQGLNHLRRQCLGKSEDGAQLSAELHEVAAADPSSFQVLT